MIENIAEFLSDVLGTTEGEITTALKDGENWKSQAEIGSYIKEQFDGRLHKAKTASRLEGHGRGAKESLTAKEKELKAKLGVEGNTIEEIVDAALESAKKSSITNPEDVRNSEVFINETKRLKAIIKEKEDEIASKETTFSKKETRRLTEAEGLKLLEKLKFVLPEDQDMKEEYLSILFDKLEDADTVISLSPDGKKLVVLDSHGKPKENETGTKEISFEDLLGSKAKRYFKQAVADDRKSPANKNKDIDDKKFDGPEMKSSEDYYKALNAEKDPAKQRLIKAHYDKQVEDGVIK